MRTPLVKGLASALTLCAAPTAATRPAVADPIPTYLAIGDSVAFGETDFSQNPSNGDRGYVNTFANFLGSQDGGVRPRVVNLGVDGETTSTFFKEGNAGDGSSGNPNPQLNTNYASPASSQNTMLISTINAGAAVGQSVGTVSVQLGANDLFTVLNSPGFATLTPDEQQAKLGSALQSIQANYSNLMNELHAVLPNAKVLLMGYYDPYAANPTSPIEAIASPTIKALNTVIAGEAAAFGATYVDTYDAIKGHELQDTLIASGNVHPNQQGYNAIAASMEAATVPEPSTILVLGVGLAGWAVLNRRRARRPVA